MRYLHSHSIIHRDLNPSNIFVDWDWIVRIGDLSHSVIAGETEGEAAPNQRTLFDAFYAAPECFYNSPTLESDVFSFGVILCELLSGETGFSRRLTPPEMMKLVTLDHARPSIPSFVCNEVRELIVDCLANEPYDRPSFQDILIRLDRMDFRITARVKTEKVRRFMKAVKAQEKNLGIDIEAFD
jgi:serine/threonine protein kinase